MLSGQDEVRAIQKDLEPWIRRIIQDATRSCVRRKTVTVATAPNGSTMGVKEPYDDTVMDVPYVSTMSGAAVGDTVTIEWMYGLSNAWVVTREGGGGGGGVAGVASFKGRTGAVTPLTGDYTAAMVGAVPTARTVNGKALTADITLTAKDVGARPDTWTPTAAEVGALPDTVTIPTKTSDLTNDSGFTTTQAVNSAIQAAILDSWGASY